MDRHDPSRRASAIEQLLRDYRELAERYEALAQRSRAERDLSRAREVAAEEERSRALGELSSGVAHELNGVLHAMSLHVAALRRAGGPRPQPAPLCALERLVCEAAKRVQRLGDLSRRRRDAPDSDLDLAEAARAAADAARPHLEGLSSAGRPPVKLESALPALPRVAGDADEVRQVLSGLVANALDAMPGGGTVRISGEARGAGAVLRVEDEGVGISEEARSRLFDPFFTTKGSKGTGLGGGLARGVMERLGGAIHASNRPGGGAAFELVFPPSRVPRAAPARPASALRGRVLVVDDDPDILEAARLILEDLGQEVVTVSSGPEALVRAAGDVGIDLVLLDLGMPGMDGWQVANALRRMRPGLRVYLVTAWANEIAPDDPRRAAVSGVMPKPLPTERLEGLLALPDPRGAQETRQAPARGDDRPPAGGALAS